MVAVELIIAIIGGGLTLLTKNLFFLLLLLPLFIFGGFTLAFTSIPWYIWAVGVLIFVIILTKGK
jgi:hypothetical protein